MSARLPWRPGAIIFGLLLQPLTAPAWAQVGVRVAVDSGDQVNGVSVSDGRPILSLNLSYDSPSGIYGGLTAIGVDTRHAGPQALGYVVYAGYARRLGADASWEVGVSNSQVTVYQDRSYSDNYTELYAGFTEKDVSAHIYYSPDYLGGDTATVYVDLDGALRPAEHWRLLGHVGMLTQLGPELYVGDSRTRIDLRAGVAREFGNVDIHLALTATSPAPVFPPGRRQAASALLFGAAYFF